jgi:hypothetical protein
VGLGAQSSKTSSSLDVPITSCKCNVVDLGVLLFGPLGSSSRCSFCGAILVVAGRLVDCRPPAETQGKPAITEYLPDNGVNAAFAYPAPGCPAPHGLPKICGTHADVHLL